MFEPVVLEIFLAPAKFGSAYVDYFPAAIVTLRHSLEVLNASDAIFVPAPCVEADETGCQIRRTYLMKFIRWTLWALGDPEQEYIDPNTPVERSSPSASPGPPQLVSSASLSHEGVAFESHQDDDIVANLENPEWLTNEFAHSIDAAVCAFEQEEMDRTFSYRTRAWTCSAALELNGEAATLKFERLLFPPYSRNVRLAAAQCLLRIGERPRVLSTLEELHNGTDRVSVDAGRELRMLSSGWYSPSRK